jgi:hypothetical protein
VEAKQREKIKFLVVIGLAVVFVIVAYFRFMPQEEPSAVAAPAASVDDSRVAIPGAEIENRQRDSQSKASDAFVRRVVKRDIFTPMNIPLPVKVKKKTVAQEPVSKPLPEATSIPAFSLGGTIVGGDKPIAIINNQFVRTGDSIGGFKVVRIDKFGVQLASEKRSVRLEMHEND